MRDHRRVIGIYHNLVFSLVDKKFFKQTFQTSDTDKKYYSNFVGLSFFARKKRPFPTRFRHIARLFQTQMHA